MDLFENTKSKESPLAARMRPRNLDEYIGQDHIVGKGRLLRRAIAADQLSSLIFYGPPGTGKTTLACVIANHTKSEFITLNAVLTGVQNIREAVKKAEEIKNFYNRRTILFVDEVHRWNKSQQDALLPWVENGTIILIGATTENPFFEVNKALVSRSRIFQLKPLTKQDLIKTAENALKDKERGYGKWNVVFEKGALEHLIETANGDARSLLNSLELAVETTPEKWNPTALKPEPPFDSKIYISMETAEESIQKKVVLYDKDGDYHYDIISAFIKSLRGRDPDAALYWLARMVRAGEDPHFIFRRMLISSCEDTGLADPKAVSIVESCAQAFDRVGMPEGRYFLAHATLYLATAPKSNSSMAFFDALSSVEKEDSQVPNHLKDSSRDSRGFGHGDGYLYPHAYKDHWIAQQYLPNELMGKVFYTPSNQGYEATIKDEVLSRREVQIAAILEQTQTNELLDFPSAQFDSIHKRSATAKSCANSENSQLNSTSSILQKSLSTGENLTFSPNDEKRAQWQRRVEENHHEILLHIRNEAVKLADLKRHFRCLVYGCDDGLFLWELWRKCPEGFTAGICISSKNKEILEQYASTLEMIERPIIANKFEEFSESEFDVCFFKNPVSTKTDFKNFSEIVKKLKSFYPKADIIIAQKIPGKVQYLSNIMKIFYPNKTEFLDQIQNIERLFYQTQEEFCWATQDFAEFLKKEFFEKNFSLNKNCKTDFFIFEKEFIEKRSVNIATVERWLNLQSSYGSFLHKNLNENEYSEFRNLIINTSDRIWDWHSTYAFIKICHD